MDVIHVVIRTVNPLAALAMITIVAACSPAHTHEEQKDNVASAPIEWIVPDTLDLTDSPNDLLIKYGRALVANTAFYLGPKGTVAHKSNGLNCQNCHLEAGTKKFGSNFSLVAANYPRFKERSGSIETILRKVNDCFERSLNGQALDTASREMHAFIAYLKWIGKDVLKGTKPEGSGIRELALMSRAADTVKGKTIYISKCQVCHGKNGDGTLKPGGVSYTYPPLWGRNSYNMGASIYRVSKLAGYLKDNMPFGSDYKNAQLSEEDAWDVAAFVNSKYHPAKDISADYPDLASKPYDYPFAPYADTLFNANQRKYGPYDPIVKHYQSIKKKS